MDKLLSFSEKQEIVNFIKQNNIKILNLCHIPEDGRLKTLSFSAANEKRIMEVLEFGERVDGSNLFSFIEPNKSDIYIKPNIHRAFSNPFSIVPALNILCEYLDQNGNPLDTTPQNVLSKAEGELQRSNNIALKAFAELEFYVISKQESNILFPCMQDKHYHESAPFTKFEDLRNKILVMLNSVGIATKYAHSEVGNISMKDGTLFEQHEVEFKPASLSEMADTVAITKWIVRNICARHGMNVSFSPKIALEHAGNGMHIHFCGIKNERNIVANPDGTSSVEASKMIGGILRFAPSLTAFGNPTPASYMRFIARKESPMHICWSSRNRSALIRIPLWWSFKKQDIERNTCIETIEYRSPDPFSNVHLLFAGIALAIKYGLENSEETLKIAELTRIEEGTKKKRLKSLPKSCYESANNLRKDRRLYEINGTFPKRLIDKTIEKLKAYKDKDLWKNLTEKPEKIEKMLEQYLHYG